MNKIPIIILESWEYEWASHVGARRYIENWNRQDAQHYRKSRMEDDRTAQVAACVSELAVAKYTNRYWSGHVWPAQKHMHYRNIADVGENIEVKRLRTKTSAPVRKKQLGKGLVLFVAKPMPPEFREVEIYGFIGYDKAWEIGLPSQYDPENTREISIELLRLK